MAEGIDDYVVKGAPVNEILARLKVARRVTQRDRARREAERQIARPIALPLES
jgi:DNA-binding response OmpR family regulator